MLTRKRLLRIAVIAALAVFLVKFASTVDWNAAANAVLSASPGFAIAVMVATLVSVFFKAVRWWIFLRPAGSKSFAVANEATFFGASLNSFVVANAGEVSRVVMVSRLTGLPSYAVLATLALDKIFDIMAFALLVLFWAMFLPGAIPRLDRDLVRYSALAFAAAIGIGLYFWARHVPEQVSEEIVPRARGRVRRYFDNFWSSARVLPGPSGLIVAMLLSIAAWAAQVACAVFAAMASHVEISIAGSVAALIALNLGVVLRATPGNVGVFQVLYVVAAEAYGVPRAQAVAVSLLLQTLQTIPMLLAGAVIAPLVARRGAGRSHPESGTSGDLPSRS